MRPALSRLAASASLDSLHTPLLASCAAVLLATATTACSAATGSALNAGDAGSDDAATTDDGGAGDAASDGYTAPVYDGGVVTIPLSACVPGMYTAPIGIGATQTFNLAIDTGSTTLGVASSSCTNCGVKPTYAPGSTAVDEHQKATSQYGSGSWSGEIYQDSVVATPGVTAPVKLVAIDSQSSFFQPAMCDSKTSGYQGIMGMGPAGAALAGTNGYFDQLVTTAKVPNIFATQLCPTGGTLWLGGYDPTATTGMVQYTPEIAGIDAYYYAVDFASIGVNGMMVPVTTTQYTDSVVDTGTSVFILPTTVFNAVTMAIASSPNFASIFGSAGASWFSNPNNCMQLTQTKAQLDAALPPMTLVFGSNPGISVQAAATESYLVEYQGYWCPSLYAMDPSQNFPVASILGSPVLRSSVVVFDRANKRIGFAPHQACP